MKQKNYGLRFFKDTNLFTVFRIIIWVNFDNEFNLVYFQIINSRNFMSEKKYSYKELRAIISMASKIEHSQEASHNDFSMDDIKSIASSSGISDDSINEALSYLNTEYNQDFYSVKDGVVLKTILDMKISELDWEEIVSLYRKEFKSHGTSGKLGQTFEWYLSTNRKNIHISATKAKKSTLIKVYADYSKTINKLKISGSVFGFISVAIVTSLFNLDAISNWLPAALNLSGAFSGYLISSRLGNYFKNKQKKFLLNISNQISSVISKDRNARINFTDEIESDPKNINKKSVQIAE